MVVWLLVTIFAPGSIVPAMIALGAVLILALGAAVWRAGWYRLTASRASQEAVEPGNDARVANATAREDSPCRAQSRAESSMVRVPVWIEESGPATDAS